MTSVGFSTFLMTLAMENVLPEPVTPRSVWCFAPDKTASVSFAMACGWSPAGWYGETSSNTERTARRYRKVTTQADFGICLSPKADPNQAPIGHIGCNDGHGHRDEHRMPINETIYCRGPCAIDSKQTRHCGRRE